MQTEIKTGPLPSIQETLCEHGATIARIDERTILMRKEQIIQTKTLGDITGRVQVVETKQKISDKSSGRSWGILIGIGLGVLAWLAQYVAETVLAAL